MQRWRAPLQRLQFRRTGRTVSLSVLSNHPALLDVSPRKQCQFDGARHIAKYPNPTQIRPHIWVEVRLRAAVITHRSVAGAFAGGVRRRRVWLPATLAPAGFRDSGHPVPPLHRAWGYLSAHQVRHRGRSGRRVISPTMTPSLVLIVASRQPWLYRRSARAAGVASSTAPLPAVPDFRTPVKARRSVIFSIP